MGKYTKIGAAFPSVVALGLAQSFPADLSVVSLPQSSNPKMRKGKFKQNLRKQLKKKKSR